MFDNGAFSAYTNGYVFDEPGYLQWLQPILCGPHWAVVPDVIGGPEDQQRQALRRWPYPGVLSAPVWHLDKSFDYLRELLDGWPRVCFGSAGDYWQIGSPAWKRRMDLAFAVVVQSGTGTNIHGLRMTAQGDNYPFASVDSTNLARNHKNASRPRCPEDMARSIDAKQGPSLQQWAAATWPDAGL